VPETSVERSPDEIVADADAHGHVVRTVLALAEPYRTTILLRYFEALELTEVAARMGVPLETVRTRLRRAHERLRGELRREHGPRWGAFLLPLARCGHADAAAGAAPVRVALGFGGSLRGAAVLVAVVVGTIAAGAWTMGAIGGRGRDAGELGGALHAGLAEKQDALPAPPPVVAPPPDVPQPNPADERQAEPVPAEDWVARDLADGRPIPGIPLRVRRTGDDGKTDSIETRTDDAGRVGDGAGALLRVRAGDVVTATDAQGWHVAQKATGATASDRAVWLYRTTRVTVTVRSADVAHPLNPRDLDVTLGAGDLDWHDQAPDAIPSHERWLLENGLDLGQWMRDRQGRPRATAAGTFDVEVPVLASLVVGVYGRGWIGVVVPLRPTSGHEVAPVDVELRPAPWIRGRLAGPDGPMADVPVQLTVSKDWDGREINRAHVRVRGAGTGGTRGDPSLWNWDAMAPATTGADGTFAVQLPCEGAAVLWSLVPGFRPLRRVLGEVGAADVDGVEVTMDPAPQTTVRLLVGGAPAADRAYTFQWKGSGLSAFILQTDAAGRARTDWFVDGATLVSLERTPKGSPAFREVVWTGQDEIRFDELELQRRGGVWSCGSWTLPRPGSSPDAK
jgi:hypothetical protein